MIVSPEAIFLSTFVLISQNRTAQRDDEREQAERVARERLREHGQL